MECTGDDNLPQKFLLPLVVDPFHSNVTVCVPRSTILGTLGDVVGAHKVETL